MNPDGGPPTTEETECEGCTINSKRVPVSIHAGGRCRVQARRGGVYVCVIERESMGNYLREDEAVEMPGERGDSSRGSWRLDEGLCLAISYVWKARLFTRYVPPFACQASRELAG